MNRRLDRHIAKEVAEKRGLRWALANWTYHNWGATKEEIFHDPEKPAAKFNSL